MKNKKLTKKIETRRLSLPRKVKVGPYTYKVCEVCDLKSYDGKPAYGLISVEDGKIYIEKKIPKKLKQVALLHEICHAILISSGMPNCSKETHIAIDSLSTGLVDLLNKHKGLKKYLTEH